MADIWKKELVHRKLCEAQSAVNSIGDVDPDILEKLDEVVLSIYDQFDIVFVRCESCQEDLIKDEHHAIRRSNQWYCLDCHRRIELAQADTEDHSFTTK